MKKGKRSPEKRQKKNHPHKFVKTYPSSMYRYDYFILI